MLARDSLLLIALVVGSAAAVASAQAHDDTIYPDLKGGWRRAGGAQWDPDKPSGLRQQAPLTPEYQRFFEGNLATTEGGGQGYNAQMLCYPGGMPRLMVAYGMLEFVVTPVVTYMRSDHLTEFRRIFTDGRDWPEKIAPSFQGYSIGRWRDEDGDGRYETLEVETRGFKGPRVLDASGIPLHKDNATIVKEQIFLDKADRNILRDAVTTIDHAFTRPWTVTRSLRREGKPVWIEEPCAEGNRYVQIGGETYVLTLDRILMPTRKDQPPPDLRNFNRPPG
jgi:hypothetical protein